jgi:hypothetical protein
MEESFSSSLRCNSRVKRMLHSLLSPYLLNRDLRELRDEGVERGSLRAVGEEKLNEEGTKVCATDDS